MVNVPVRTWRKVFIRDLGICQYCGADLLFSLNAYMSAETDHIKAVSVGGTNDPDNLVLSCSGCNRMLSSAGSLLTIGARKAEIQRLSKKQLDDFNWFKNEVEKAKSIQSSELNLISIDS